MKIEIATSKKHSANYFHNKLSYAKRGEKSTVLEILLQGIPTTYRFSVKGRYVYNISSLWMKQTVNAVTSMSVFGIQNYKTKW